MASFHVVKAVIKGHSPVVKIDAFHILFLFLNSINQTYRPNFELQIKYWMRCRTCSSVNLSLFYLFNLLNEVFITNPNYKCVKNNDLTFMKLFSGDNYISKKELKTILTCLGEKLTDREVGRHLNTFPFCGLFSSVEYA